MEGSYPLEQVVPVEVLSNLDVENAFEMYEKNGSYKFSGSMYVIYELIEDEEPEEISWMIRIETQKIPPLKSRGSKLTGALFKKEAVS